MTDTALDIDLDSLIDMSIAPQCEHHEHDDRPDRHGGDAKYLIHRGSHCQGHIPNMLICEPIWSAYIELGCRTTCPFCRYVQFGAWKIIEVL